ncbi:hypothetical protein MVES1_003884 [Malassezia vespertilionis]|uniref:uncharacterized protein n=1 Tax=Malassezia vespertilionis TaxID=2020962 RepID=UPI0024B281DF|nr:uncharacterized protein MVES1_003884 [Malassezia vespertilionis]WFD08508.1 hypothetical protein MVES1_003884 [Malassezia vespertilionis]
MVVIAKPFHTPVLRDVLFQSIRRAPTTHTNNGDSLRRVVLQRNAHMAAADADTFQTNHFQRHRRMSMDMASTGAAPEEVPRSHTPEHVDRHGRESPFGIRRPVSRSIDTSSQLMPATLRELELEDAWFEGLFEELQLGDEPVSLEEAPLVQPSPHNVFAPRIKVPAVQTARIYENEMGCCA